MFGRCKMILIAVLRELHNEIPLNGGSPTADAHSLNAGAKNDFRLLQQISFPSYFILPCKIFFAATHP
jgi:hypothetical protein